MNIIDITRADDTSIDVYVSCSEPQLRHYRDPEGGVFIAESPKVIERALDAGCVPKALLMERKHIDGQAKELLERYDVPVYTAQREVLENLTGYALTRGILCAMRRRPNQDPVELCQNAKRVAVLEGVVDATNIGAIFRSAAALGVDAVLVTPDCCDPLCRRAVRVSMGTIFRVPWGVIGKDHIDWRENGPRMLRKLGFKTAAMALTEDSVNIDDPALMAEERVAVILGTEGTGLSKTTIKNSDYTVMIPMANDVDSLNVLTKATLSQPSLII